MSELNRRQVLRSVGTASTGIVLVNLTATDAKGADATERKKRRDVGIYNNSDERHTFTIRIARESDREVVSQREVVLPGLNSDDVSKASESRFEGKFNLTPPPGDYAIRVSIENGQTVQKTVRFGKLGFPEPYGISFSLHPTGELRTYGAWD